MKTQFGSRSSLAPGTLTVQGAAKASSLTENAVSPVAASAAPGEERHRLEPDAQKNKSQHPILGANARLIIEKDQDTGDYIYKTIDRDSGEVIKQWPREKLLKAISDDQTTAGLLIDRQV